MVNISERLKIEFRKGKQVFVADTARIIGDVELGDEITIMFGAVLRGDIEKISIDSQSNIQDNAVIHADPGYPVTIGKQCIVGHSAIIHGAKIANNVLIGMHATVMNGVSIGAFSIIGAGAVVPEGMQIPANSLVLGIPAKIVKTIDEIQKSRIIQNAMNYVELGKNYLENGNYVNPNY